ncbi:mitochondrial import inner membrane translocase subunit TIM23-2 [Mercurialis annua]|uniref:mitochondrial import inner membrane translocase subunit TIM23-2 n=1 Tax=Mercurialis annua TaxID=3986 RepID=UPI00215F065A|nr:mitochondrial import inner membrane translocase subunit TIM23-2 [Mercurialis annua]
MDVSKDKKVVAYHPYQDLYNVPAQNLYKLPTSPEFLFHEEAARQRRSWSENLQYYTGTGYLSGAIIGAGKGTIDGIKSAEPGDTTKLRVNRVLNSGGHMGRKFGNNLGVLGLMFAGIESVLIHYRDTDDLINPALAGLGTGAVYRAARGPRSAAIAGAVGGIAAAAAVASKQVLKRYVPI